MEKSMIFSLAISLVVLFSGIGFAAQLNVSGNATMATQKSSVNSIVPMLNFTFTHDVSDGINITQLNFTFNSTTPGINGTFSNLSICAYNTNLSTLLNCSSGWNVNTTNVTFSMETLNNTNYTIIIAYNTSGVNRSFLLSSPMNVSLYVPDNSSIITNDSSTTINSTYFPLSSGTTSIRIVQASSSISPRIVDTNVTNQTLRYYINATDDDTFENLSIIVPPGFTLVNVSSYDIYYTSTPVQVPNCVSGNCSVSSNRLNISYATGIKNITVYFNVNTNQTFLNTSAFNSTIDGTNFAGINVSPASSGYTNTTTKMLINITYIQTNKSSAFLNGTDYWEFNFTVNVTDTVPGMVQFKMTNWNSTSTGVNITLYNTSNTNQVYASLRKDYGNLSNNIMNVTNDYNLSSSSGVYINATAGTLYNVYLRMIIPLGTPVASDWWATYGIIFRTIPSP